mmetsp:Transcript_88686/g.225793  ORF Transcript_88686/g.225793 Transcript_88686/m.225793 type:complete len:104 (+) Transcript_88686:137-448(+)
MPLAPQGLHKPPAGPFGACPGRVTNVKVERIVHTAAAWRGLLVYTVAAEEARAGPFGGALTPGNLGVKDESKTMARTTKRTLMAMPKVGTEPCFPSTPFWPRT